ncbi:MAG TPA: hypothetical protein P5567_02710 [Kiritimatiellia bacterium]|nr:hypothetical protein [Kiritimatiellia bacterium]HRZ11344.1 hypothetical protein [Kiritimatiellia bacterium]HSA17105.1 hypothetical protein [Kiritimatiellia bacterium]
MRNKILAMLMSLWMGAGLVLVGCEDDGGGDDSPVDVTGTWTGEIVKESGETGTGTLILVQNGTNVTGTDHDTWTANAAVQGSVDGRNVELTIMDDVGTHLSGHVSGDRMDYTWTSGDGTSGSGTLTRQ